jgi:hypothetical protein
MRMPGQRYRRGTLLHRADLGPLSGTIQVIATEYPYRRVLGRDSTSTFAATTTPLWRFGGSFPHRSTRAEVLATVMFRSVIATA